MCGLVCFGFGVKFHFLGIKAAKLSVCTLCTLFLAQQNVRAGPKNLGGSDRPDIHQTALLPFKLRKKKKRIREKKAGRIRAGWIEVGFNWWVLSLFACQKVLLFTVCVGVTI